LVEGNSIEEVIDATPDVVKQLLTARKEKLTRQKLIEERIHTYKYLYSFA
jgi:LPS O-antigen subunit length determinant protein (WzzB/FepE family)